MRRNALLAVVIAACAATAGAAERNGFSLSVSTDGSPRREYHANDTVYVEAVRGSAYALRITNPMPYRVAVALSVDGLNTIDAKHTDAWSASKWVLDPYESTTISGWQVSGSTARKFFFTGEKNSYGAALGKTKNLGVIQAVFYREREPVAYYQEKPSWRSQEEMRGDASSAPARPRAEAQSGAAPPSAKGVEALSDDFAATGMGRRTHHEVTRVAVDLDPAAVASISIRYEFRPQLVKLGVLREPRILERREHARGFESYCPQPD